MSEPFSSFSLSRRRLLITTSAVAIAALSAMAGLTPAHSAGGPQNGGDIT